MSLLFVRPHLSKSGRAKLHGETDEIIHPHKESGYETLIRLHREP